MSKKGVKMNFSEVAEALHISRAGSRQKILKNKDAQEIKEYLIYDKNKKIVGLKEDGIEILRNLGATRRSFAEERNLSALKSEIALKTQENDLKNEIISNLKKELARYDKILDEYRERITKLENENEALKNMSFWQRLTFKK